MNYLFTGTAKQVQLISIPGHRGIESNEKSDRCAVTGLSLDEIMV